MKSKLLFLFILVSLYTGAQNPTWRYLRPTNSGIGGDYQLFIEVDACGNKWTGGYLPFFSQGSVVRFDDTVWTAWSNFENYIPADRVYGAAFDSQNGLWVACNDLSVGIPHGGIAHYDGNTWTQFTSANSPLPEDNMRGIVVDHNDVVWATFRNTSSGAGGVSKYDGTNWTIYTPSNSPLPIFTNDIDVDAQNNIWIGTNTGLVKFDGTNWTTYTTVNSGLSLDNIRDVEVDESTNKIYVATGISIDIYDGATWTHLNSSNSPIASTNLYEVDARGDSIIIGTLGGTSLCYIYNGATWISHPEPGHCYDVRIDNDGYFWICGIGYLEKYDGINWTRYDIYNTGLVAMFNKEVFIDSRNRKWIGSDANGGVNMFDCPIWEDYNPWNSLNWPQPISYTGTANGFAEDTAGDIWMAFNGAPGGVVQIPNGDVHNPGAWVVWDNSNSGISMSFVYRMAADQSGNVWVGYDQACSVSKYSHSTNSWINYNLFSLGQITCGAGSGIKSIRVDSQNNVWICGDAGLAKYDQANWTFYSHLNTPMQQGTVYDIAFDTSGNKWVATEHGLYKFDGTSWVLFDHTNAPLYGDVIKAVLVDDSNLVWIANEDALITTQGGLSSYDGTAWTNYTTLSSGLPETHIERLAQDTLGDLWIVTTGQGVAIFNPVGVQGLTCINYNLDSCSSVITLINEASDNNLVSCFVYPNPAASELRIKNSGARIDAVEIYSVLGEMVLGQKPVTNSAELVIDIISLPNGIYFLQTRSDSQTRTQKFIISR